ncbi:MAG: SDR family NAD(P)-dependent oxidoreductase [Chloroflexi bacterium]|nr:SDR family NAD(P)-dependent oxidoreductase [Chloroflexota bacterium]
MDLDVFDLQDKTALIVGGGRGIGRSSSLTLARAGCNVAVADNDETRGEAVATLDAAAGTPTRRRPEPA